MDSVLRPSDVSQEFPCRPCPELQVQTPRDQPGHQPSHLDLLWLGYYRSPDSRTPYNQSTMVCVNLVGGFNPSEKYQSVGKDYPIYYGTEKMFETTNQ